MQKVFCICVTAMLLSSISSKLWSDTVDMPRAGAPSIKKIVISSAEPTWLQVSEVVALDGTGNDQAIAGNATASGSAYGGGGDGNSPQWAIDGVAGSTYPRIYHSATSSGNEALTVEFKTAVQLQSVSVFGRSDFAARDVYDVRIFDSNGAEVFFAEDQSANNSQNQVHIAFSWSEPDKTSPTSEPQIALKEASAQQEPRSELVAQETSSKSGTKVTPSETSADPQLDALARWGCIDGAYDDSNRIKQRAAIRCWRQRANSTGTGDLSPREIDRILNDPLPDRMTGRWSYSKTNRDIHQAVYLIRQQAVFAISCPASDTESAIGVQVSARNIRGGKQYELALGAARFSGSTRADQSTLRDATIILDDDPAELLPQLITAAQATHTVTTSVNSGWVTTDGLADALADFPFNCASAAADVYAAALQAAPYGLPPLTGSEDPGEGAAERATVWEGYGLEFRRFGIDVFVASIAPGGVADQMGLAVGDIVAGDMNGGFSSTRDPAAAHRSLARTIAADPGREATARLMIRRGDTRDDVLVVLPHPANIEVAQKPIELPSALHAVRDTPAIQAIYGNDLSRADPADLGYFAMLFLDEMAWSASACLGPNPVAVRIPILTTTTTRNGFGTVVRTDEDVSYHRVTVRPYQAEWVRQNVRFLPRAAELQTRTAYRALIETEGCGGADLRTFERGVAMVTKTLDAFDARIAD